MVTLTALQSNPLIKSIYAQRLEKGMEKMSAIGYCMHKILRIIYGMLKSNTAFDPEIDHKNREKEANKTKSVAKDASRRYQGYDSKAPISGRQSKRRMERKQSQNDRIIVCGIKASVPIAN